MRSEFSQCQTYRCFVPVVVLGALGWSASVCGLLHTHSPGEYARKDPRRCVPSGCCVTCHRWHVRQVGASASECDTIPGRQCMASCFFLLKQFEDVLIYLKSIKTYFYNDDDFNWNYGIAKVEPLASHSRPRRSRA